MTVGGTSTLHSARPVRTAATSSFRCPSVRSGIVGTLHFARRRRRRQNPRHRSWYCRRDPAQLRFRLWSLFKKAMTCWGRIRRHETRYATVGGRISTYGSLSTGHVAVSAWREYPSFNSGGVFSDAENRTRLCPAISMAPQIFLIYVFAAPGRSALPSASSDAIDNSGRFHHDGCLGNPALSRSPALRTRLIS